MNSTTPQPEQVPQRPARRWRPQFGLRTLLVGSLLIGVVLAKVANDARRQREIVARIHALGGQLWYAGGHTEPIEGKSAVSIWLREQLGGEYFESIKQIELGGTLATDDDVLKILSATTLTSLSLGETRITDAALAGLVDQTRLESLSLNRTRITDAGLVYLRHCPELARLDLTQSGVTTSGLEHLKVLSGLKRLDLDSDDISDEGMAAISEIKSLDSLSIENTCVTSAGLEAFRGHANLRELNIRDIGTTGPGLVALAEMPSLRNLELGGMPLSVHDMAHLSLLHQVQEITLPYNGLNDEGLRQLAAIRPRTHLSLQLSAQRLTKSGILCLKDVPNLRSVTLKGCRLSDDELNEVRDAIPFCTIKR